MPFTETTILMILPALLVLVGMFTGYCMWGWLRGIDQNNFDELQDEIRGLGRQIERNKTQAIELHDLQFENQELQMQIDSMADSASQTRQQSSMELQEVASLLEIRDTELRMAESTIADLKIQIDQLKTTQSKAATVDSKHIERPTQPKSSALRSQGGATTQPVAVNSKDASKATSEPMILRLDLPKKNSTAPQGLDSAYGGEVIEDEKLGLVYSRPPLFNDNLQLISGIAAKLENQLNEFGVYTFQQIMLWSQENIDQFSSLLNTFQDRIERDDWVGQAEMLYQRAREMRKAS